MAQANTLVDVQGWSPFVALQLQYRLVERGIELDRPGVVVPRSSAPATAEAAGRAANQTGRRIVWPPRLDGSARRGKTAVTESDARANPVEPRIVEDAGGPFIQATPTGEGVTLRAVEVPMPDGVVLRGDLRVPNEARLPAPAVVLSHPGPVAVSDQSVVAVYGERLAQAGHVTLALDPRGLGRSQGEPRQHFDVVQRLRDLEVGVSYLSTLSGEVDPNHIGAFGASAGGSAAAVLAAFDPRVKAFACVCGGFFNPRMLMDAQGVERYEQLRRKVFEDVERYHLTGELSYEPVVTPDGAGAFLVGLDPHPTEPFDYYGTARGATPLFENRVTSISRRSLINFDWMTPVEFVGDRAGLFIAGTEDVYVPLKGTREAHRRLTGPKDLLILSGANHIDLYDNERYVSQVLAATVSWFGEHLSGGS